MNTVSPNPYSPYATADPYARHLFPTLFGPPTPGTLLPTGCFGLAVAGEQPVEIDPTAEQLPDGLCTPCVAHMRGLEVPDSRPQAPCLACGVTTRHNGLCAICRAEAHEVWQTVRTTAAPPPEQQTRKPFIVKGGPLSVTTGAFCEHGDFAFTARFRGYHIPDGNAEDLTVVLPRCYVAELLGAALAVVDHDPSPEAQDRFADIVTRTQATVREGLERRTAERKQNGPDHG